MKIGVRANYTHNKTPEIVKGIISWCRDRDIDFAIDKRIALEEGIEGRKLEKEMLGTCDAIIVIGGDGTILSTAGFLLSSGIPILGINVGGLGFLTVANPDNYKEYLEKLVNGDFVIQDRMMLEVEVVGNLEKASKPFYALNEAVISKGGFSRIVQLKIEVGDDEVGIFKSDGIIVATPTGSTGYSLSSGGPLVLPSMDVIVVTPICPHTLGARPLVIPSDKDITIEVMSRGIDLTLTLDGQKGLSLSEGSRIVISRSKWTTRLMRTKENSFFSLLRSKLGWIARED